MQQTTNVYQRVVKTNRPGMSLETISPTSANELLQANTCNRPLDLRRATLLAQAITRGEWQVNGDTIRVSEDGVLLDGQHRLKAICLSGQSVQTFVVRGLPRIVFETIDVGGAARTFAHVLALKGKKYYSTQAAIARLLHIYTKTGNPFSGNPHISPSAAQLLVLVEHNPAIGVAAAQIDGLKWARAAIQPSALGFCFYTFSAFSEELACEFFSLLNSGAGLEKGSPILALRDRLLESSISNTKLTLYYKTALVFKAFKHFRDGASVKNLRVRVEGDSAEKDIFVL